MRALLVCTRDPGGRQAGRKAVLRTIVRSLRNLGHDVDVVVLSSDPPVGLAREFPGLSTFHLGTPSLARVLANAVLRFLPGALSLNECLFFTPRTQDRLRALVAERGYDVVIADMIRAVPVTAALHVPVIVDLDDRLSRRYEEMLERGGPGDDLLGYVTPRVPSALRGSVTWLALRLLRREARVLRRREIAIARSAAGVSLVSRTEADQLQRDAGVPVAALPMAVAIRPQGVAVSRNPAGAMAFVGGLDYHANVEGISWFAEEVLPLVRERLPEFEATVIGECPPRLRSKLERPGLVLTGYIPDLDAELARQRGFIAPVLSGHGIKTKVLEAMAAGLPVVSTTQGITGLEATDGETCLVADSPIAFANAIASLAEDPQRAGQVGGAARSYVAGHFSDRVLTAQWQRVLTSIAADAVVAPVRAG